SDIQQQQATITIEGQAPPVLASRTFLQQALINLLTNALKFVPQGVSPRIVIRLADTGDKVRLWVEDNGIGIAPENQQRIFRIFERLRSDYPGTGIGLAIVQKAALRMGGRVGVESAPGQGGKFRMELPK